MTTLSPAAVRFIGLAVYRFGEPRHKAAWVDWTASPGRELLPHLAQVALHAMPGLALRLEDRIGDEGTPPELAAEMENDLAFAADNEELLLEQLRQPIRAYEYGGNLESPGLQGRDRRLARLLRQSAPDFEGLPVDPGLC